MVTKSISVIENARDNWVIFMQMLQLRSISKVLYLIKTVFVNMLGVLVFVLLFQKSNLQNCYQWNSNGRLQYQQMQLSNPSQLTTALCQQICLANNFLYTAMESGQFCFCSTIAPNAVLVPISQCNSPCPGYAGDPLDLTCGSVNDNILIVDLKNSTVTANSTTLDVSLYVSPTVINVADSVSVYANSTSTDTTITFSFDFGDGSPVTDWYAPSALPIRKYFYMPGTFQITAWVQSALTPLMVESWTTISINPPAPEISAVNCPSVANISEMVTCWFTVNFTSHNATISVDFGDFTNTTLQATSTQYFAVGKTPPLYGSSTERFQTSFPPSSKVFMKESEFQRTGTIYGFESVNTNGAQLVLQVVCPSLICDYCFTTNNCSNPSCPPSTITPSLMSFNCPASRNLYFNALDEICYSAVDGSRAAPYTRYSVDYDYSLYDFSTWSLTTGVLMQGNNWFPLLTPSNRIPVTPGCALGYQPISGLMGYRVAATYAEEADDFVHLSAGYADQPVRARHFLKAYCFQSQNITFTKSWFEEGQYDVNVTLTDPTGNNVTILPTASVLVEIEFLVQCPSLAVLNRTIICTVLSPNISVDGYYAWAFGDGSLINFAINRKVSYAYMASGVYEITVLRQSFSGFISTYKTNITVINCLCCPPYLTPLIFSTDFLMPYTFYRYQTIHQNVLIQLSCSTTLKNSKIWAVRQVDPIDPTTTIRAFKVDRLHQNDSFLTIDPYVLDFGLYEVNFTIIMETTETLPENHAIASTILGYFEVIPTSIMVVIYKNMSRIIVSSNDTVMLDPGDYSIDRNIPFGSYPQFTSFVWSCVKIGSKMTSSSLDPDLNSWMTNCDAGGGVRFLDDSSWSYLKFDASKMTIGAVYIVTVNVSRSFTLNSGSYSIFGWATLQIDISNLNFVQGSLQTKRDYLMLKLKFSSDRCKKPDLCVPESSALLYNPNDDLILQASCSICVDDGTGDISWNFTNVSGSLLLLTGYIEGTTSLSVRISQQFFASTSSADPILVNFLYTSLQLISNYAQIKLIAMTPPAPGNCSINATNVRSINDNVFLTCSNWTSNYGIEFYFLYVLHPDGSTLGLYAGPKFLHSVTLPAGLAAFGYQYSLMVTVYDYYGSSTDYSISAMQVMPYINGFTENLLDQLNLHLAECNEFSVLLYVVSLASSLNTFYYSTPGLPAFPAQTPFCSNYYGFATTCDARSYSAFLRNQMLSALEQSTRRPRTILDISTMSTAIFTLTTVIADVGIDGQQNAATMLIRMTSLLNQNYHRSSPNVDSAISGDYFKLTGNLVSVINYGIDFSTNTGDQVELQLYEYNNFDSSLPENPNDIVYYEEMTIPEWQADAGRRAQLKVAKNMSSIIQKAVDAMSRTLLYDSVLSNNSVTITIANGTMLLKYCRVDYLTGHYDLLNESLIDFPAFCDSNPKISVCGPTIAIQSKVIYFSANLYHCMDKDQLVTTGSVEIEFRRPDTYEIVEISNSTFSINLTYLNQNLSSVQHVHVTPALPKTQILKIHRIDSWKPNASMQLEFTPDDNSLSFAIFILNTENDANDYVGPSNFNFSAFTLAFSYPFYWILPSDGLTQSTGIFYVGVGLLTSSSTVNAIKIGGHYFLQTFSTGYDLRVTAPSCLFYAKNDRHWEPPGCHVVGLSTVDQSLSCSCYHLTVFGGGFFVPPNNIDFEFVFTHADFDQNITIYATIIILLLTYATLLVYCRIKDRKDIAKLACVPLPENDISDRYIYEVATSTGLMKGAATDSKVSFIISGSYGSSGTRNFGHPLGKDFIFRRGMVNHFILTCRRSLGDLHSVRIWHDNSGQGEFSGWFLNEIVIFDVQTDRKSLFVCNEWLAVEHADSCTDRVIPVANERKVIEFDGIFSNFTRQSLLDDHIWLSVFTRPLGTRFTRVQRLSCCFCFLAVSMLTSALWYGTRVETPSGGYQIGPIYISDTEIKVGFFNNSIMVLLAFVLINMFRKSSPRKKRPSRFSRFVNQITSVNIGKDQPLQKSQSVKRDGANATIRRPFLLPWSCMILAWLLVILISIACLVFTAFYAIEFGDNKTKRWLCSTILTFFVSVFFIQPIKITITSLFLALACRKKPEAYDADWIQDQDNPPKIIYNESITGHEAFSLYNLIDPPDNSKLENLKRERQIELKMYADLREIFSTIFYICTLIVLAYGNRGQEFYSHQANLYNLFLAPNDPNLALITQVETVDAYWQWAKNILMPALRAPHYINGEPNIMERGFIADHTNRLLGHAIMRQVRIQSNTCYIPVVMQNFSVQCSANSRIVYEESGNFFVNWTTSDQWYSKNSVSNENLGLQPQPEYQYKSAYDLNNTITTGLTDFFTGGGYVVKLIGPISVVQEKMTDLQRQGWIDDRTRAVMIEFTVYDANINVFSVNRIVSEFPPYGSVISWAAFQPLRLLPFGNQYVSLEIICLVAFSIFGVIFIVREMVNFFRIGCIAYFTHFWTYINLLVVVFTIVGIISYILRFSETKKCLGILDQTHGNTIVSFQYTQLLDFFYNLGLSFCVFATMLKLITLLRFNRRISVLQSTLARCKKDLVNYFVVFGILFAAFSQSFFFILNTKLTDYKNFVTASCSIFTVLLGKGQFDVLLASSPLIPPLFVAFFVSMVIFMLRAMMGMRPTPDQKIFCDKENASSGALTIMERKMREIECRMNEVLFHRRHSNITT